MSEDPIKRTEQAADEGTGGDEMRAANVFDLRRILGGLFLLYGAILTIAGLTDSREEIDRAAGVHINLYAGIGMLVLGALFIAWGLWRPLSRELEEAGAEE